MTDGKVSDVLGIKPWGEAANKLVSAAVDGVSAFLSRICLPAAEEYGLYLRERVHLWRAKNVVAVAQCAERKLGDGAEGARAHPRLVSRIVDDASWVDDPELQDMWGGLLASSCTADGADDSNLIFLDHLSRLTGVQARVLKFGCENARKEMDTSGLVNVREDLRIPVVRLFEIAGTTDLNRLDRELDGLRVAGLLGPTGGFLYGEPDAAFLTPSPLALHLYVRCQGSRASPREYFAASLVKLDSEREKHDGAPPPSAA